jgi:hypothetical protein
MYLLVYLLMSFYFSCILSKWLTSESKKIFNLGPPKTGTSSLGDYLRCVGYDNVTHWHCGSAGKELRCGECFTDAIVSRKRLDETCGPKTAFAEMDLVGKCVLPQVTHLEWLYFGYPGSKFVLIKRDVSGWLASAYDWGRMDLRLFRCLVKLKAIKLPSKYKNIAPLDINNVTFIEVDGKNLLAAWYQDHYARIRKFFNVVVRNPAALFFSLLHQDDLEPRLRHFLELDRASSRNVRMGVIEEVKSPEATRKCWGVSNRNRNASRPH